MMSCKPTPKTTDCPECGEPDGLLIAFDVSKYYQVTSIREDGSFVAVFTGTEPDERDEKPCERLFCHQCGEYFKLPKGGWTE
jgi:hypothetical protein